ncbi:hypothetical protein J132_03483 [Termitomyces sp. J132]|nr:hypothetical protein J132_03483 [Termitomyces sp. J132]
MLLPFQLPEDQRCKGYKNYASWKINMIAHGRPHRLLNYWEDKIVVPVLLLQSPKSENKKSPTQSSLPPRTLDTTPVHSWMPNKLKYKLCKSMALFQCMQNMKERELADCRYSDRSKVAEEGGHIEKMWKLRKAANDAGVEITDKRFIINLLDSFLESWDPIALTLYRETELVQVIQTLTTHSECIANQSESSGTGTAILIDTVKALKAMIHVLQAQANGLSTKKPNSDKMCSNCGKTGHTHPDCFREGGGKQGQYPLWWREKHTASLSGANFTSTTADRSIMPGGHFTLLACITKIPDLIFKDNAPSFEHVALTAGEIPPSKSCSFADSGYTTHFFKSCKVFVNYKPIMKLTGQSSKEGASFMILGIGNVVIRVIHQGKEHTLVFRDVLHAPTVAANLILISKLNLAGWHTMFGDCKVQFSFNKAKVFMGEMKNGMYLILGSFTVPLLVALAIQSLQSCVDLMTWYWCFSHFGPSWIEEATKLVDGLLIKKGTTPGQCEDCIVANLKKWLYDGSLLHESVVLSSTNIDLWGPACVKSMGGALYAMKFHD